MTPIFVRICPVCVLQFSVARFVQRGQVVAVAWSSCFTWFESSPAIVLCRGRNFLFRTGDAAGDGHWFEPRLFDRNVWGSVVAEFMEPGAQLHGSVKEEFGSHVVEVVLLESTFHASEVSGGLLEFFFEGGDISLLEFFELEAFHNMNFLL